MNDRLPSFSAVALFNKAAGDPLRLAILRVLAQDAYGVMELSEIFQIKQSGMSHHLKVMADAGIVAKRREGNSIFYSRALPNIGSALSGLHQQLYQTVDSIALDGGVQRHVQRVQQERVTASRQFFAQQADKFKAQQDLIAEYPVYGEAVSHFLANSGLAECQLAVEVGPGAGEFLPVLANQFEQVVALDNAATMLEQAKTYCTSQALDNITFICDDTGYFIKEPVSADCVVMNMVLHHTSSPADIFADVAKGLARGGIFIVADLCRHDQDWAKTACGDVWLGFDTESLNRWAQTAGLERQQSHYLALRNGFQIQLQQFIKKHHMQLN